MATLAAPEILCAALLTPALGQVLIPVRYTVLAQAGLPGLAAQNGIGHVPIDRTALAAPAAVGGGGGGSVGYGF